MEKNNIIKEKIKDLSEFLEYTTTKKDLETNQLLVDFYKKVEQDLTVNIVALKSKL